MQRVNIVGTSGSGKTTFAKKLATQLNCACIEMDALFWKPNWQESKDEEFFSLLEQHLEQEKWVLDGNYHRSRALKWRNVDTIIWLDFSFTRTLFQACRRALTRSLNKTELWGKTGNVESFRRSFFSKESVLLWTIKTHASNHHRYQTLMSASEYRHIHFVRLTSPKMADKWLQHLDTGSTFPP